MVLTLVAGVRAMFNIISRNYYVPKLTNWLQGQKMKCRTCLALERAPVVPATGAMVPEEPKQAWQIDYVGQFPADCISGHR